MQQIVNFNADGSTVQEDRAAAYQSFLHDVQTAEVARSRRNLEAEELQLWSDELSLDRQVQKGARKKGLLKSLVAWAKAQAA